MTQTALITGASGGIGLELARQFAQNNFDLVLVARSRDKLQQLADELQDKYQISVAVVVKDLTEPSAPAEIYAELQERGTAVNILVNNAGFATYGFFDELDLQRELAMIQLNVAALTHLTWLFLQDMVAAGNGKILNVSSTAAFQPGPLMAVYYATKAYVLSFSEAIANELAGKGVTVTALCPGPTESGFQSRAEMEDSKLVQRGLMSAAEVAKSGYAGLMAGKTVVIPGTKNRILAMSPRFLPRKMVTNVVRSTQERTGSHN